MVEILGVENMKRYYVKTELVPQYYVMDRKKKIIEEQCNEKWEAKETAKRMNND